MFHACQFGPTDAQNVFDSGILLQIGGIWQVISCVMISGFPSIIWPGQATLTVFNTSVTGTLNLSSSFTMNDYLYNQREYCDIFRLPATTSFTASEALSPSRGLTGTAELPASKLAAMCDFTPTPPFTATRPFSRTAPLLQSGSFAQSWSPSVAPFLPSPTVTFRPEFIAGVSLASILVAFGVRADDPPTGLGVPRSELSHN
jgi:hypothetical protein